MRRYFAWPSWALALLVLLYPDDADAHIELYVRAIDADGATSPYRVAPPEGMH